MRKQRDHAVERHRFDLDRHRVGSVSDSATVTINGVLTWNGTVEFHLRGPIGSPREVSTDIGGPVAVSNTTPTVQSATDTVALSGTSIQPGTPAINPTTAGAPAGGTITFALFKSDCTTLAFWKATYAPATGDPNNLGSSFNGDCSDPNEDVVVTASSMTSAQSFIPNDSATVSAPSGGDLAGGVTFEVFESNNRSGTAIYTQTVAVNGASPQTVSTTNTTVSTTAANVSWRLIYTSTNPAGRAGPRITRGSAITARGTARAGDLRPWAEMMSSRCCWVRAPPLLICGDGRG